MGIERFLVPTELIMGSGVFREWSAVCREHGISRPLLVTGRQWARRAGHIDAMLEGPLDTTVFDEIPANPGTAVCEAGADAARSEGCDGVVALGGGSALDAAKAIAVLARNPGPCRDHFGAGRFESPPLPVIAVPTTAGTGSEVTPYAVLVDEATKQKRTIGGKALFPRAALLDPELTLGLPPDITRDTGLDVLSQAMEGMVSKKRNRFCDLLALEAIALVRRYLPEAVAAPDNLAARENMLLAATLSGMVIAHTGTTLVHGMGYYYTLDADVPHGLANGLLLRPVFQYNAGHLPQAVARIAAVLGHPVAVRPDAVRKAIGTALGELFDALGTSPAARDHGVRDEALPRYAADIVGDPYRFKNQTGNLGVEEVEGLFRDSWAGT